MANANTIELKLPHGGSLRGTVDNDRQVAIFRNVPFGTVPKRWRAAVKSEAWTGVRDATKQGPVCPQTPSVFPLHRLVPTDSALRGPVPEQDELNALNLNIFVPLKSLQPGAEPIPVMTYIHGGAFRDGSNALPLYDSVNFVQHSIQLGRPVIVVVANYRLNVFGFLASKELEEEMEESPEYATLSEYERSIGNWGIMDQKLAFEWVRENIAAFGGNARNVTAFGESAGSVSLHYHMILPSHRGLFDHAILQSGTVDTLPAAHVHKEGQAYFDQLLQTLNIPLDLDSKEKVKLLRAVPQDEITQAGVGMFHPYYDDGGVFTATSTHSNAVQAQSLDLSYYDPNLKSVLLGNTKDEGTAFATMFFGQISLQTWPQFVQRLAPVPALESLFKSAYGVPETEADVARIVATITGDMAFANPTQVLYDSLMSLRKTRGKDQFKVLRYHFDAEIERMSQVVPGLGSLHAGELPFLFGPPMADTILTAKEMQLSSEMQKMWILFANQQDYEAKLSPDQRRAPVADNGEAFVLTKDHEIEVGKSLRLTKDAMTFWSHLGQAVVQKAETGFLRAES
ncbi:hypothetical protein BGZ72_008570 [Mortierella alpina]|nr:hypothetical protein BGZ72_008570 [Mortierella alpina]